MSEINELGTIGLLRWIWRQLTSMRTALILLLLLGVGAIPGSLLPQRTQNPMKVQEYFTNNPGLAHWLDCFKLFDVYSSPWFSAIYLLLFISLIGCVLPRTFEHARYIRKEPPLTPRNLDRMEFYTPLLQSTTTTGDDELLDRAQSWLSSRRFRIRREKNSISAEKGYLRESGNLLFHLSLILILVGVALGSLFGSKGEAIVNVGDRFINTPTAYDSLQFGKLQNESSLSPFSLSIKDFQAKYDIQTNEPIDYTLHVDAAHPISAHAVTKTIKVNSPLTFGSTKIYLQANGYSPIITVRDPQGNITFQGPTIFLPQDGNLTSIGAIKLPDMKPPTGFIATFIPTFDKSPTRGAFSAFPSVLDPRLLFSVWQGDLGLDTGKPQSIYRLDTSKMKKISLGSLSPHQTFNYGSGSITFDGWKPWVNLQIVTDPGKDFALLGAILAILGLFTSLFGRQRRIWIKADGKVEIAGLAKNAAPGLESEIQELKEALEK